MVYGEDEVKMIGEMTELVGGPMETESLRARPELLREVEIIFAGWGGPVLDSDFMAWAPGLKAYFYAGGSSRALVTDAWRESEIVLSTSVEMNAIPVAEYVLAFSLLGLKRALPLASWVKSQRTYPEIEDKRSVGNYRSRIGLVALGYTGRRVVELLKPHDHELVAFDPYADNEWARDNGIQLVGLDELFSTSDVVTIHLPINSETRNMIKGRHVRMMKSHSMLINTARGRVLDESDVLEALRNRPDVQAVLDVAVDEPPPADSLLYTLPNIVLTPHIAGSLFNECRRMSHVMIEECDRFLNGKKLLYEVGKGSPLANQT